MSNLPRPKPAGRSGARFKAAKKPPKPGNMSDQLKDRAEKQAKPIPHKYGSEVAKDLIEGFAELSDKLSQSADETYSQQMTALESSLKKASAKLAEKNGSAPGKGKKKWRTCCDSARGAASPHEAICPEHATPAGPNLSSETVAGTDA